MKKSKQILIFFVIFILVAANITTIVLAFSGNKEMFFASVYVTFALPVVIYGFMLITKHLKGKK